MTADTKSSKPSADTRTITKKKPIPLAEPIAKLAKECPEKRAKLLESAQTGQFNLEAIASVLKIDQVYFDGEAFQGQLANSNPAGSISTLIKSDSFNVSDASQISMKGQVQESMDTYQVKRIRKFVEDSTTKGIEKDQAIVALQYLDATTAALAPIYIKAQNEIVATAKIVAMQFNPISLDAVMQNFQTRVDVILKAAAAEVIVAIGVLNGEESHKEERKAAAEDKVKEKEPQEKAKLTAAQKVAALEISTVEFEKRLTLLAASIQPSTSFKNIKVKIFDLNVMKDAENILAELRTNIDALLEGEFSAEFSKLARSLSEKVNNFSTSIRNVRQTAEQAIGNAVANVGNLTSLQLAARFEVAATKALAAAKDATLELITAHQQASKKDQTESKISQKPIVLPVATTLQASGASAEVKSQAANELANLRKNFHADLRSLREYLRSAQQAEQLNHKQVRTNFNKINSYLQKIINIIDYRLIKLTPKLNPSEPGYSQQLLAIKASELAEDIKKISTSLLLIINQDTSIKVLLTASPTIRQVVLQAINTCLHKEGVSVEVQPEDIEDLADLRKNFEADLDSLAKDAENLQKQKIEEMLNKIDSYLQEIISIIDYRSIELIPRLSSSEPGYNQQLLARKASELAKDIEKISASLQVICKQAILAKTPAEVLKVEQDISQAVNTYYGIEPDGTKPEEEKSKPAADHKDTAVLAVGAATAGSALTSVMPPMQPQSSLSAGLSLGVGAELVVAQAAAPTKATVGISTPLTVEKTAPQESKIGSSASIVLALAAKPSINLTGIAATTGLVSPLAADPSVASDFTIAGAESAAGQTSVSFAAVPSNQTPKAESKVIAQSEAADPAKIRQIADLQREFYKEIEILAGYIQMVGVKPANISQWVRDNADFKTTLEQITGSEAVMAKKSYLLSCMENVYRHLAIFDQKDITIDEQTLKSTVQAAIDSFPKPTAVLATNAVVVAAQESKKDATPVVVDSKATSLGASAMLATAVEQSAVQVTAAVSSVGILPPVADSSGMAADKAQPKTGLAKKAKQKPAVDKMPAIAEVDEPAEPVAGLVVKSKPKPKPKPKPKKATTAAMVELDYEDLDEDGRPKETVIVDEVQKGAAPVSVGNSNKGKTTLALPGQTAAPLVVSRGGAGLFSASAKNAASVASKAATPKQYPAVVSPGVPGDTAGLAKSAAASTPGSQAGSAAAAKKS